MKSVSEKKSRGHRTSKIVPSKAIAMAICPIIVHFNFNGQFQFLRTFSMSSCVHQTNLCITPVPSNVTRYAQKTLCAKTPLSRVVTGKTFTDMKKKKEN